MYLFFRFSITHWVWINGNSRHFYFVRLATQNNRQNNNNNNSHKMIFSTHQNRNKIYLDVCILRIMESLMIQTENAIRLIRKWFDSHGLSIYLTHSLSLSRSFPLKLCVFSIANFQQLPLNMCYIHFHVHSYLYYAQTFFNW